MADYYNSEGYASPTEYEAFTHIEREEKAAAKAAAEVTRLATSIIESAEEIIGTTKFADFSTNA